MKIVYWLLIVSFINACTTAPQRDPAMPRTLYSTDNESGIISITVPGDWVHLLERTHSISISNAGRALRSFGGTMTDIEAGEVVGSVLAQTKETLPDSVEDTPTGIMNFVIGTLTRQTEGDTGYSFGSIETTTLGDYAAFYSDGLATTPDTAHDLRLIVLDAESAYGILFFGAPFDELAAHADAIEAIAASFTFEAVAP